MADTKELIKLESVNAVTIFTEGGLDDLLGKITMAAKSFVPDITTTKGRDEIKSIAAKVAKSKTYLDAKGKDLVSGWKTKAKMVDVERKRMRDALDELKVEIRKPVTDFEDADKARVADLIESVEAILKMSEVDGMTLEEISRRIDQLNQQTTGEEFQEFQEEAERCKAESMQSLEVSFTKQKKYEDDQAELAKLKAEAAEREEADRVAKIKADAETKAKLDAEKAVEVERQRAEKAEQDAKDAAERAEKEKQEAVAAAERKAKEEADRKEQERLDAERIAEAAKQKEREVAERKAANARHRNHVDKQAIDALVHTKLVDKDKAAQIVAIVAAGEIPGMQIIY